MVCTGRRGRGVARRRGVGWRSFWRKGCVRSLGCLIAAVDGAVLSSCKAVFVDTDLVPAKDSRVGDLVQNTVEATLIHQLAEVLIRSGVAQEQIGVISLYRQQVKLLAHLLHEYKGVEILTADRSQGRDKDCIIISMVRSNDSGEVTICSVSLR